MSGSSPINKNPAPQQPPSTSEDVEKSTGIEQSKTPTADTVSSSRAPITHRKAVPYTSEVTTATTAKRLEGQVLTAIEALQDQGIALYAEPNFKKHTTLGIIAHESPDLVYDVCKERLAALKRYFSSGFIRWFKRLFSRNSAFKTLKMLEASLLKSKDNSGILLAFLDKLNVFEQQQDIFSLQNTLDTYLFNQQDNLSTLFTIEQQALEKIQQLEKRIVASKHDAERKAKPIYQRITKIKEALNNITGEANSDKTEPAAPKDRTLMVSDFLSNLLNNLIKEYREYAIEQDIPKLTYTHCYEHGILEAICDEQPEFGKALLKTWLAALQHDVNTTFYRWSPWKSEAEERLEKLNQLINKNFSDPKNRQHVLAELKAYETRFNKASLSVSLNCQFIGKEIGKELFDVVTTEKVNYHNQLENWAQSQIKESAAILAKDTTNKPVLAPQYAIKKRDLLKQAVQQTPDKLKALIISTLPEIKRDVEGMALPEAWDTLDILLKKPEYSAARIKIEKHILERNLLQHVLQHEPATVKKLLIQTMSLPLLQGYDADRATALRKLVALRTEPLALARFIKHHGCFDLENTLCQQIGTYYFTELNKYVASVTQKLEKADRATLYNALSAAELLTLAATDPVYQPSELIPSTDGDVIDIGGYYQEHPLNKLAKKAPAYSQQLTTELAWRFINTEQVDTKKRLYFLAAPSREAFFKKATATSVLSNTLNNWLPTATPESIKARVTRFLDQQMQDPEALLYSQLLAYIRQQHEYETHKTHEQLLRLQQYRFDLFALQKNYVYQDTVQWLDQQVRPDSKNLAGAGFEDRLERLQAIDRRQQQTAPYRPASGDITSAMGAIGQVFGPVDDLNAMLDDLKWKKMLTEQGYDYSQLAKEYGVSCLLTPLDYIKSLINKKLLSSNKQTANNARQTPESDTLSVADTGHVIDYLLNNIATLQSIAKKNPKLVRVTLSNLTSVLSHLGNKLGWSSERLDKTIALHIQCQNFVNKFIGDHHSNEHDEKLSLSTEEIKWVHALQFVHDTSCRLVYVSNISQLIEQVASSKTVLHGAIAANAGFIAWPVWLLGLGVRFAVEANRGISVDYSRKIISDMKPSKLANSQAVLASLGITNFNSDQYGTLLRYIAENKNALTSDSSATRRLLEFGRIIILSFFLRPVQTIKLQFNKTMQAWCAARQGQAGGWQKFAKEIGVVSAIIVASLAAASVTALSGILTSGVTLSVVIGIISTFLATAWTLSGTLLHAKHAGEQLLQEVHDFYQEKLFSPHCALVKSIKRQCLREAKQLVAGEFMDHEAYVQLQELELNRQYYKQYWDAYCRRQHGDEYARKQFQQQQEQAAQRWLGQKRIKIRANDLLKKSQALAAIDGYLANKNANSNGTSQLNALEKQLKKLGIIENLPTDGTNYYLQYIRDELTMFLQLEYGDSTIPQDINSIQSQLAERYTAMYLGHTIRQAWTADTAELKQFEARFKKLLKRQHSQRIARCAANNIQSLLGNAVDACLQQADATATETSFRNNVLTQVQNKATQLYDVTAGLFKSGRPLLNTFLSTANAS